MTIRSKGEIGLWTLECCALTDNCGNRDNSLIHYTNDNKHVSSQCHSHTQIGASVVRSIPKAYSPSPNHSDSVYDSIYSRPHSGIRRKQRARSTESDIVFGPLVYAVTIGGVTMYQLQNTHTYWVTNIRVFNHPFYLKLHFGLE